MSSPIAEPLFVLDSHAADFQWIHADDNYRQRLVEWMRSQDLDPEQVNRIEVYLVDTPHARVWDFLRDEDGYLCCPLDHDHRATNGPCLPARGERYDVVLSSLPPRRPGQGG